MIKTLRDALRVQEIRKRIFYTFMMLIVIRIGSQIPVPGTNGDVIKNIMAQAGDSFNFFNSITGGSFENFSIFALSISPYITSSIIMQLLTIAIPKLEEMNKDGADGRKKIAEITRYVTIGLAIFESLFMTIGFSNQGLFTTKAWYNLLVVTLVLTAGSAALMWIGEQITEKGIGNGISVVLLINILSRMPNDFNTLYQTFIKGKEPAPAILAIAIILAFLVAMVVFVVLLQGGMRKIPVQYSRKQGNRVVGGSSQSHIPLKVNTAGVIPVIFAGSIFSVPQLIASYKVPTTAFWEGFVKMFSTSSWLNKTMPWYYNFGFLVYIALIILFAYFYTSITFNPIEIADNMKKNGGFVPGIRPGKTTADYLTRILNYIVFIGASFLAVIAIVPVFCSGVFGLASLSFLGTSIIIIVGVIIETLKQIESMMVVRSYKGFLNN